MSRSFVAVVSAAFTRALESAAAPQMILASALLLAACDGPLPAGKGNDIDNPTLTIGAFTFIRLYCDGTFDGFIPFTAAYTVSLPPKTSKGKTTFKAPQATTPTNVSDLKFSDVPLQFTDNGVQNFGVTGKLDAPCSPGTFGINGTVTYEQQGGEAAGGPYTVGPVAMIGNGPSPDPKASRPNGAFSFNDTLHCCRVGNPMLKAVAGSNVSNPAVSPAAIACAAGPAANDTATMSGRLVVVEVRGIITLVITDAPQKCTIKTTVQPPS